MIQMIGNTEKDERGLLPYPVIIAATKGDPEAKNDSDCSSVSLQVMIMNALQSLIIQGLAVN